MKRKPRRMREVPLTAEDQYIYLRTSSRHESRYRLADRDDALVVELRLRAGGVVANVRAAAIGAA